MLQTAYKSNPKDRAALSQPIIFMRASVEKLLLSRASYPSFAPFVAGIGYMSYRRFYIYNIAGAILWIGTLLYLSFWFGNLPAVKEHFSYIVIAIIGLSILPPVIEVMRRKYFKSNV